MAVIGLIGAGRWGNNWIRTLNSLPEVSLAWCCDSNESVLERLRRPHPAPRTTTRAADLFEDPSVEGVVIATSAPTHFALAEQALRAGKHVLVEKPMTLDAGEARALAVLSRRIGRVLMVGHLLDYYPALRHIEQMLASGELGDIHYLVSQRLNFGTVRSQENAWWSLAPHDISMACRLLGGMPRSVQCRGQNIVQPGIADVVFATLEFPKGQIAHIHVSWLDPHKTRKLTVVGSRKMVVFDDTHRTCPLTVHDKGYRLQKDNATPGKWVTLHQGETLTPELDTTEPLALEARHFLECMRTGLRPRSDGEAGTQVVSVLECGQRSLDCGGEIVSLGDESSVGLRCT